MRMDLMDHIGDYISSEYYALLDPGLKEHAEVLLSQVMNRVHEQVSSDPTEIDSVLLTRVLLEQVAPLDLSLVVRQEAPQLLQAFFSYLALSGKFPQAAEWSEWMPEVEAQYSTRLRSDGTVRGETVRNKLAPVGRNEPCPCGSGKKFKKCCIDFLG